MQCCAHRRTNYTGLVPGFCKFISFQIHVRHRLIKNLQRLLSKLPCLAFKSFYDTVPYSMLNSTMTLKGMASIMSASSLPFLHLPSFPHTQFQSLTYYFSFLLILFLLFESLFQYSLCCIKVSNN